MEIICIDDQQDVQELMSMMLEDELNANVHCFGSAKEAELFLKTTNIDIEVILCDYKLKNGETGIKFSNTIKSLGKPFVLITGMCFTADDAEFNDFIENPSCSVIYKPFSDDELTSKIKEVVL